MTHNRLSILAFYLPQFHPVPENNRFWGEGFTEWQNVAKARPLFRGHLQPRLPGSLGFYDLRLPEVRSAQARLAQDAGISAFCYWHYWFGGGRTVLERPFDEVVASGEPDFPFCLAWANESWTGIWHGAPNRLLIEQQYPGVDDIRRHFQRIEAALHDPRYFRIGERPVFYVLQPMSLPQPNLWCDEFRSQAELSGLSGMYLVGQGLSDPRRMGFDAGSSAPAFGYYRRKRVNQLVRSLRPGYSLLGPKRRSYRIVISNYLSDLEAQRPESLSTQHPTILSGWDNTPRSGRRGYVLQGFTPRGFEWQVSSVIQAVNRVVPDQDKLVFLKSWNEWAEGNILEPDSQYGMALLNSLRKALGVSDSLVT